MEETFTKDQLEVLRTRETELMNLIQAFSVLEQSKEWNTVKELVYGKSLSSIERQLLFESLNPDLNPSKISRLQGEYAWAKQFCDPDRFIGTLKKQLEDIKLKLKQ